MCLQLKVKDVAYAVLYSSKISDFLWVSYLSKNCEIRDSYRKQKRVSDVFDISIDQAVFRRQHGGVNPHLGETIGRARLAR